MRDLLDQQERIARFYEQREPAAEVRAAPDLELLRLWHALENGGEVCAEQRPVVLELLRERLSDRAKRGYQAALEVWRLIGLGLAKTGTPSAVALVAERFNMGITTTREAYDRYAENKPNSAQCEQQKCMLACNRGSSDIASRIRDQQQQQEYQSELLKMYQAALMDAGPDERREYWRLIALCRKAIADAYEVETTLINLQEEDHERSILGRSDNGRTDESGYQHCRAPGPHPP